jgi:hypothetical protein
LYGCVAYSSIVDPEWFIPDPVAEFVQRKAAANRIRVRNTVCRGIYLVPYTDKVITYAYSWRQVAKLMHRPRWDSGNSSSSSKAEVEGGSSTSVVSSQSLIMEDRPPGLPAKQTNEKVERTLGLPAKQTNEKVERT